MKQLAVLFLILIALGSNAQMASSADCSYIKHFNDQGQEILSTFKVKGNKTWFRVLKTSDQKFYFECAFRRSKLSLARPIITIEFIDGSKMEVAFNGSSSIRKYRIQHLSLSSLNIDQLEQLSKGVVKAVYYSDRKIEPSTSVSVSFMKQIVCFSGDGIYR